MTNTNRNLIIMIEITTLETVEEYVFLGQKIITIITL